MTPPRSTGREPQTHLGLRNQGRYRQRQAGLVRRSKALAEFEQTGATRLIHGVRLFDNEKLSQHVRIHRVAVVTTPSLELAVAAVRSLDHHPIAKLNEAGIFVVPATGVPGLLESGMASELQRMSKHQKWRLDKMRVANARAIDVAFIEPRDRYAISRAVENWKHRPKMSADIEEGYQL